MQYIELTKGYVTAVDSADYERVAGHEWRANVHRRTDGSSRVYAMRAVRCGGRTAQQMLHRFIMDTPAGMDTDHINGNGLDNRRSNLRVCTHGENMRNRRPQTGVSSAYKGVSWNKAAGKWLAQIRLGGKHKHLGLFTSEQDAAAAYDRAAQDLHGAYARTNGLSV